MDRRAVFFFLAAAFCAVLIPFIPHESGKPSLDWVGWTLVIGYVLLGLLSWLDAWARSRARR